MTVREILIFPQYKTELRRKSAVVAGLDYKLRQLIRDLKDTLQASADGIGLAAPQINVHQRVVIVYLGNETNGEWQAGSPVALINPVIVEASEERRDFDGCLSLPGLYGNTNRPHHLHVTGLDEGGKPFDQVYDGFNAVVVHHEIDHLDGVLFIDRIENLQDLFTLGNDEHGKVVRIPFTASSLSGG